jgi:acetyl-CoA C-acetyltransferase
MIPLLNRHRLKLEDIDYWEINEAFAAQILACLKALNDDDYCREHFDLKQAFGQIPNDRLNVAGGGISIGHPVGASGARIVLHLLHTLQRTGSATGVASLCIGGGQGGAMLIKNIAA